MQNVLHKIINCYNKLDNLQGSQSLQLSIITKAVLRSKAANRIGFSEPNGQRPLGQPDHFYMPEKK